MKKIKNKYIRLTESQLQEIVDASINKLLFEYAKQRKDFYNKAKHLTQQVIENWCLVKYRTLTNTEENKEHWKSELYSHMDNIGRDKLKGNNSYDTRYKVIQDAFDYIDANSPEEILIRINNKFRKENIDINSIETKTVAQLCFQTLPEIIDQMSNYDGNRLYEFVNKV